MAAEPLMSALTILPSTILVDAIVTLFGNAPAAISLGDTPPAILEDVIVIPDGNAPVPSLVKAIAADEFISASTIVPSTILELATVIPVGRLPVANLESAIAALLLTSESCSVPSAIIVLVTLPVSPVDTRVPVVSGSDKTLSAVGSITVNRIS